MDSQCPDAFQEAITNEPRVSCPRPNSCWQASFPLMRRSDDSNRYGVFTFATVAYLLFIWYKDHPWANWVI
jgi:hypothetical protein